MTQNERDDFSHGQNGLLEISTLKCAKATVPWREKRLLTGLSEPVLVLSIIFSPASIFLFSRPFCLLGTESYTTRIRGCQQLSIQNPPTEPQGLPRMVKVLPAGGR